MNLIRILLAVRVLSVIPAQAIQAEHYQAISVYDVKDPTRGWTNNLAHDYNYARCAPTYEEAKKRWDIFLAQYDTPEEYEDGFHVNHVMSAHMELARVYYVLDDLVSGDKHYRHAVALW